MDIEKLIEKLRTESLCADKASLEIMDLCMEAAAALSTLQDENAKLRDSRDRWKKCAEDFSAGVEQRDREDYAIQEENEKLRADLARVTAERDAAISDLTCIARTYPVELCDDLVCQHCKHYPNVNTGCPGWTDNDCFEWRGMKED